MELRHKREQDEREFADLSQAQRKDHVLVKTQAGHFAGYEQHERFYDEDYANQGHDLQRIVQQQFEVDGSADRDKEQSQQNAFKRFDVAFELVPEFAGGQNQTGEKRSQG